MDDLESTRSFAQVRNPQTHVDAIFLWLITAVVLCSMRLAASSPETVDDAVSGQIQAKRALQQGVNVAVSAAIGTLGTTLLSSAISGSNNFIVRADDKKWKKVELPIRETLFDITFDPSNPEHGWLIGSKGTFLETFDGGNSWNTRSFTNLDEDEEITYRFEVASLLDNEGWIVGKPAILLHTKDGGKQFERIPLSPKLPGEPCSIIATGPGKAEMITNQGAIYTTVNGGLNWKAQVKETIDATLNRVSSSGTSGASFFSGKISNQVRDKNGNYIAIGSRGNLFLTWGPGQDYWVPHNRGSSRRIQNMGFIGDDVKNGLWMTLNGGALLVRELSPNENTRFYNRFYNKSVDDQGEP